MAAVPTGESPAKYRFALQDMGWQRYYVYGGNFSFHIRNALRRRRGWEELDPAADDWRVVEPAFNFVWKPVKTAGVNEYGHPVSVHEVLGRPADRGGARGVPVQAQLVNHFAKINCLTTKTGIVRTLADHYSGRGASPFSVMPTTYIVKSADDGQDAGLRAFVAHCQALAQATPRTRRTRRRRSASRARTRAAPKQQQLAPGEAMPAMHSRCNLWLIKPGHLNQGRGIKVVDSAQQALEAMRSARKREWVVQKYLESPLLILERKFDIRVWVLVTQALDVYVYREGYLRTSSEKFSLQLGGDASDSYVHLTNHCFQKNGGNYGRFEEGNTLSFAGFQAYLDEAVNPSRAEAVCFRTHLWPAIRAIAVDCIRAAGPQLGRGLHRECFELFGFDFMIDRDMRPWVIEVNTNPYLGTPCTFLRALVPCMVEDMVRTAVDHVFPGPAGQGAAGQQQQQQQRAAPAWDEAAARAAAGLGGTNGFELVYRDPKRGYAKPKAADAVKEAAEALPQPPPLMFAASAADASAVWTLSDLEQATAPFAAYMSELEGDSARDASPRIRCAPEPDAEWPRPPPRPANCLAPWSKGRGVPELPSSAPERRPATSRVAEREESAPPSAPRSQGGRSRSVDASSRRPTGTRRSRQRARSSSRRSRGSSAGGGTGARGGKAAGDVTELEPAEEEKQAAARGPAAITPPTDGPSIAYAFSQARQWLEACPMAATRKKAVEAWSVGSSDPESGAVHAAELFRVLAGALCGAGAWGGVEGRAASLLLAEGRALATWASLAAAACCRSVALALRGETASAVGLQFTAASCGSGLLRALGRLVRRGGGRGATPRDVAVAQAALGAHSAVPGSDGWVWRSALVPAAAAVVESVAAGGAETSGRASARVLAQACGALFAALASTGRGALLGAMVAPAGPSAEALADLALAAHHHAGASTSAPSSPGLVEAAAGVMALAESAAKRITQGSRSQGWPPDRRSLRSSGLAATVLLCSTASAPREAAVAGDRHSGARNESGEEATQGETPLSTSMDARGTATPDAPSPRERGPESARTQASPVAEMRAAALRAAAALPASLLPALAAEAAPDGDDPASPQHPYLREPGPRLRVAYAAMLEQRRRRRRSGGGGEAPSGSKDLSHEIARLKAPVSCPAVQQPPQGWIVHDLVQRGHALADLFFAGRQEEGGADPDSAAAAVEGGGDGPRDAPVAPLQLGATWTPVSFGAADRRAGEGVPDSGPRSGGRNAVGSLTVTSSGIMLVGTGPGPTGARQRSVTLRPGPGYSTLGDASWAALRAVSQNRAAGMAQGGPQPRVPAWVGGAAARAGPPSVLGRGAVGHAPAPAMSPPRSARSVTGFAAGPQAARPEPRTPPRQVRGGSRLPSPLKPSEPSARGRGGRGQGIVRGSPGRGGRHLVGSADGSRWHVSAVQGSVTTSPIRPPRRLPARAQDLADSSSSQWPRSRIVAPR